MPALDLSRFDRRDAREIARAIRDEATRMGFVSDPSDAVKLVDDDLISVDDSGEVIGVRVALALLARDRPGYFASPRPRSGGTPPRALPHTGGPASHGGWASDAAIRRDLAKSRRYTKM